MSILERIASNSFKTVVRQSPAKPAEKRRSLEAAQAVDCPIMLASRYNFSPPLSFSLHQKHDPILRCAYPILHNFSYSTFDGYINPLEIEPLFSDDAVFLHQALFYGAPASAMYVIGRYGFLAKVRLFLNGKSGQAFVQDKEKFIELPEWLQSLPPPAGSKTGARGYEYLLGWWAATGHSFNIMDLPVELWTYIFELAFGVDIYPSQFKKLGEGRKHYNMHRNALREVKSVAPPTISILYLNKKIHTQLLPFVHKHTCKCFPYPLDMRQYLTQDMEGAQKLEHLRSLELDFNLRDYMLFFGVEFTPFESQHAREDMLSVHGVWREASVLKHLSSLTHLFLRFPAPSDGKNDPWHNTGHLNGHEEGTDWKGRDRSFSISCQKVLVDWILTFAFEHIHPISKITLHGYIKNSTKAKWDRLFKEGKVDAVGKNEEVEMSKDMIRNWDKNDLGPSCHCTNFCGQVYREPFQPKGKKKTVWRRKPFEFDYED